jgi:hypothetical protein
MAIDQSIQAAGTASSAPSASVTPAATASGSTTSGGMSFRTLLSDLNPLQYIPGVGAIYRAVTGDEGNSTLRFIASLGTSFALGGPVGVGITVAEKVTGIDPEKIGRHLLAGLFHSSAAKPAASVAEAGSSAVTGTGTVAGTGSSRPWTAEELAAYGVKSGSDHELAAGSMNSADVLNTLELHRLSTTYA